MERALRILLCFTPERPESGVTELSRQLGLSKGTVHRLLGELVRFDFLHQDPATQRYQLGYRLVELARVPSAPNSVRRHALPLMHQLHQATNETIALSLRVGQARIYVEQIESSQGLRHSMELGRRFPLYLGAAGKAILAALLEQDLESYLRDVALEPFTSHTVTDPDRLRAELAATRQRGYSVSREERVAGGAGVGAAILCGVEGPVGALTISPPASRLLPERVPHYGRLVSEAAAEVSRRIQCV